MKSHGLLIPFLLLIIVFTSCAQPTSTPQPPSLPKNKMENNMPEKMPEDFNFSVRYGYGEINKNEINTFESMVTKDLISKGTISTTIKLSPKEMNEIYAEMRKINIMKDLKLSPSASTTTCQQSPFAEDQWTIKLNGEIIQLTWSNKNCVLTEDAKQLKNLREHVFNIIKDKQAYKALPEAVGGYD